MTNEEAKTILKGLIDNPLVVSDYLVTALDIAIKALEKATPEFVNYASDGEADGYPVYDFAYCPNCEHLFEDDDEIWEANYCPYCGKALKWWEDVDDDK